MVRTFRFGVSSAIASSRDEWHERVGRAEELGYDAFLIADHLRGHLSPLVALASAAEASKSLTFGTFVLNNDFRHPVLLAREAATLQVLTGGRFELGLGAGHSKDEYDEAGFSFDAGPVRVERLGESVEVIQQLFSGKPASFAGDHYQVANHTLAPLPERVPPLLIGGNAKSILQLAARKADIVGFTGIFLGPDGVGVDFRWFTLEGLEDRHAIVREAAGDRFGRLELNILIQVVNLTDDREHALSELSNRLPALTVEQLDACPYILVGNEEQIAKRLVDYRDRFGISYIVTHAPGMEALAPVIRRLKGK